MMSDSWFVYPNIIDCITIPGIIISLNIVYNYFYYCFFNHYYFKIIMSKNIIIIIFRAWLSLEMQKALLNESRMPRCVRTYIFTRNSELFFNFSFSSLLSYFLFTFCLSTFSFYFFFFFFFFSSSLLHYR